MSAKKIFLAALALGLMSTGVRAQLPVASATEALPVSLSDSLLSVWPDSLLAPAGSLPATLFLPATYTGYDSKVAVQAAGIADPDSAAALPAWLIRDLSASRLAASMSQRHAVMHPDHVPYNLFTLPAPPEQYVLVADPERAIMVFKEAPVPVVNPTVGSVDVAQQDWLNKLGILLQFSQGFVSPNWYQGGNSSFNLVTDFTYQSNLNTKFHPNFLFENFFQWRTSLTSTDDDPYRKYSFTENRFQINSKFGYKAAHNWYYTFNGVFKTPVFCGYKNGTKERTASFLSPGELNIGLGMTYNFTNKKKTFTLGVTISPLSYNLKTVIDNKVNEVSHGIDEGHRTKNSVGSNAEINWNWKICYNVAWKTRIFAFTNYEYFQGDWQNQFSFTINRFLTANLFVDMRYDSSVPPLGTWRRWQLREQLTLGFSYTFSH